MLNVPTFGIIAITGPMPNNGRGSSNGCADAVNCAVEVDDEDPPNRLESELTDFQCRG